MKLLQQALELLTSAYAKKDEYNAKMGLPLETEIGKLFAVLCWGLEKIEDNAQRVREWSDIDKARGRILDRYGENYGVARGGADDMFYRLLIKIKMIAQLSGGDIDTVINAVSILYDLSPEHVELVEHFPAKIRVFIDNDHVREELKEYSWLISKMMRRIVAAGVGFDIFLKVKRTADATVYTAARAHTRLLTPAPIPSSPPTAASRKVYTAARVHTYYRTGGTRHG